MIVVVAVAVGAGATNCNLIKAERERETEKKRRDFSPKVHRITTIVLALYFLCSYSSCRACHCRVRKRTQEVAQTKRKKTL